MKITYKRNDNRVKFSELKTGDTFIDPDYPNSYSAEMKIDYADIFYEFAEEGERNEKFFASVSLETGNVFFYNEDFYVIPIKLKVEEE